MYHLLVNPDLINQLLTSPDTVYHTIHILQALKQGLIFDVGDDKLVFIQPYPLSFPRIVQLINVIVSFYAGFEPVSLDAMETMQKECAPQGGRICRSSAPRNRAVE